jgi:hypothetical protein
MGGLLEGSSVRINVDWVPWRGSLGLVQSRGPVKGSS